jgi:hypothetical protein
MFAAPLMAALTALVPPILFATFALVRVQQATEVNSLQCVCGGEMISAANRHRNQ